MHVFDGMPDSLIHGAEEGANKIAGVVETASARVARRVAQTPLDVRDARLSMKDAKLTMREKRLGMMERLMRRTMRRQVKMLPSSTDAMVKAQLVKTSRELAHESSDLSAAIESLNKVIRANRRAAAGSRTRLLGGLAMGAALMYHLDAQHGRERRAATGELLTRMIRGQSRPPTGLS